MRGHDDVCETLSFRAHPASPINVHKLHVELADPGHRREEEERYACLRGSAIMSVRSRGCSPTLVL
jgi:hypothetical protein